MLHGSDQILCLIDLGVDAFSQIGSALRDRSRIIASHLPNITCYHTISSIKDHSKNNHVIGIIFDTTIKQLLILLYYSNIQLNTLLAGEPNHFKGCNERNMFKKWNTWSSLIVADIAYDMQSIDLVRSNIQTLAILFILIFRYADHYEPVWLLVK